MPRTATALLAAGLLAGCSSPGLLYTDITVPLTLDVNATPRATGSSVTVQRSVREPLAGIRAEWASTAPREQARLSGMDSVSYADVHRQSLIGGLWGSTTLVIHGQRDSEPASVAAAEEPGAPQTVPTP